MGLGLRRTSIDIYWSTMQNTSMCLTLAELNIQGVSGEIVNILGGGSMDYSE